MAAIDIAGDRYHHNVLALDHTDRGANSNHASASKLLLNQGRNGFESRPSQSGRRRVHDEESRSKTRFGSTDRNRPKDIMIMAVDGDMDDVYEYYASVPGVNDATIETYGDVSEVPFDTFAEGEILDTDMSDTDAWDQRSSSQRHYSATNLRFAGARCSSSTLYDETRPPSSQGSWSQHTKDTFCNSREASPVLFHSKAPFQLPQKEQTTMCTGHQSSQQAQHITGDSDSATSFADRPSSCWKTAAGPAAGTARLKIEPSTPVPPPSSSAVLHGKDSGVLSAKGSSSPLRSTPTTPLTPIPTELDKPTRNLMIFNQIPRQWPSSQETLHQNYNTSISKKTPIVKGFDTATAERIDRVINKDRPLSRAAKEKLAAEQKEAELEARGFFDPACRWKGRDVYPRPANWVYCRRTKNNWLEKSKILADRYKLFKGQVLGKGHHADVYKGIDLTTGQDLAIKLIYKTITRRLGFVNEDPMQEVKNRRLLNEAWFIDYLKDTPGISKVLRVVETTTKFYFVMELAHSDLNSYSNGINMREEEIRHILKPIFECLKYAHSRDITHRDIKPENILLRTRKDWLQGSTIHSSGFESLSPTFLTSQATHSQPMHMTDDNSSMFSNTFVNEPSYIEMDAVTTDGRSSMDSATLYHYDHRFDATLADWGLAAEHDCISGRKPVGTPLYAAPEV
ncbi:CBL-interacting serine/threonine-protein kinase 20, partial [Gamsiella multidivaricata]